MSNNIRSAFGGKKALFILLIIFCLSGCSGINLVGEYDCLDYPGYTYNENVGACVNEADNFYQEWVAKKAVDFVGRSKGLVVVSMFIYKCPGCTHVNLEKGQKQPKEKISVKIDEDQKLLYISHSEVCMSLKGNWLDEYNECEYIANINCKEFNGDFFECESACRHTVSDEPIPCTLQCVQVCKF
jgi:hypothetical protein